VPLGLVCLAALLVSGACRQDMHQAPRYDPLEQSDFFADQRASRPLVEGTVARGFLKEDTRFWTGKDGAAPVTEIPVAVTRELLERGRERYDIYCSPCHARTGDGTGMVVSRGFKQPPSYHIDRLRAQPVGYFYDVITNGFGAMQDYSAQIPPHDRWAIVAYVRALQLSRHAPAADLSPDDRTRLEGGTRGASSHE
jgi:mono/diheme cytochrome c family protein